MPMFRQDIQHPYNEIMEFRDAHRCQKIKIDARDTLQGEQIVVLRIKETRLYEDQKLNSSDIPRKK